MRTYISEEMINASLEKVLVLLRDKELISSYIPYQIGRERDGIVIKLSRFYMFAFKDKFKLEQGISTKELITYNLKSDKGNSIEIIFTLRGDGRNNTKLNVAMKYEGEKEWIVGKYLKEMVESIIKSLKNELEKRYELEIQESFSKQLGKLSFISKLLMKSRLVKSEEIEVRRGMLVDILLTIIQDLMRYQLIYVSGTSESSSFRVLMLNGEVRGVYVVDKGAEDYNENSLNSLEGKFKVNVYVSLAPEAVLRGVMSESS